MQNENLKKSEKSEIVEANRGSIFSQIDLDTKKEIAKIGMTASMGITVATSFYMKNKFMKNLHIGAGVALVGFSFWHHMLYQPNKNQTTTQKPLPDMESSEYLSISLKEFYLELTIDGTLTATELINFEDKIEALLNDYKIDSMNILVDIRDLEGIELKAIYEDFLFAIRHFREFNKIAVLGNSKFEKYTVNITDKLVPFKLEYFEKHKEAHDWLLD